jgi:hypothetical protein
MARFYLGVVKGKQYFTTVDDRDLEWLSQWSWDAHVRTKATIPYVRARRRPVVNGKRVTIGMHRAIWVRHRGEIPKGMQVDHKKHGKYGALDNRLENLRLATQSEQCRNQRKQLNCSSKFKGVRFDVRCSKNPWQAHIKLNGRFTDLGSYPTERRAASVYDIAAIRYFGEFALLNLGAR